MWKGVGCWVLGVGGMGGWCDTYTLVAFLEAKVSEGF